MIFNRRLKTHELEPWLSIERPQRGMEEQAMRRMLEGFMSVEDSMFYLTTLDDEPIGGTVLFRNRTRLSIGLLGVRISPSYRQSSTRHIINSSLPLFRTAKIHAIDALIGTGSDNELPVFPLGFELPSWSIAALEELGFNEVGEAAAYVLTDLTPTSSDKTTEASMPSELDSVEPLLEQLAETTGLDCAQVEAAARLSMATGSLRTLSDDDGVLGVVDLLMLGDRGYVRVFGSRDAAAEQLAEYVAHWASESDATSIEVSLVGEEQRGQVEELASLLQASLQYRKLRLMRKSL